MFWFRPSKLSINSRKSSFLALDFCLTEHALWSTFNIECAQLLTFTFNTNSMHWRVL